MALRLLLKVMAESQASGGHDLDPDLTAVFFCQESLMSVILTE